ncbi:MAG: hypothetical protein IKV25_00845 [Clostridia bacterium]|nr:hypothetical protein [Clostridia bacterium]
MAKDNEKFLTYKGKPLVRNGNTIYYGFPNEKYVIMMQILATKPVDDVEVASKVSVQLINTDPNVSIREKIVKSSEKKGLYAALDIAEVWLNRALAE